MVIFDTTAEMCIRDRSKRREAMLSLRKLKYSRCTLCLACRIAWKMCIRDRYRTDAVVVENMKILIADSGSTKTDWALGDEQGNVVVTCKTQGISPIHQSDAEILDVLDVYKRQVSG